jgi:dolichyl-phosphate beta-glucosyltransferase
VCRPLVEGGTSDGFGFDIELLYEAHRAGLRIREIPVRWNHCDGSKVNMLRDGLRMLRDIYTVRLRGVGGSYDRAIQLSGVMARRDAMSRVETAATRATA